MTNDAGSSRGMSLIVKTVTRLLVGLILLYGIYIVLHGHVSPGGGFAGGFIIALSYILFMLAFGKEEILKRIPQHMISFLESLGALMFLAIALLGFLGGHFFFNWLPKGKTFELFSAGTIPLSNIALALLEVSLGLFGIFLVLVLLKFTPKNNSGIVEKKNKT